MGEAPLILGVSGLRGIVGQSLTPEVAARFAGAFATWLCEEHEEFDTDYDAVLVARDGRAGGEIVHEAVIAGLLSAGLHAIDLGIATTPTAGAVLDALLHHPVLGQRFHAGAAMVVTASHNPSEWNGVKCIIIRNRETDDDKPWRLHACAPPERLTRGIIARFQSGELQRVTAAMPASWPPQRARLNADPVRLHAASVSRSLHNTVGSTALYGAGLRAVVDSVNASGAEAARQMLVELGVGHVQLAGDGSGVFPHPPEPTAENLSGRGGLCDAVPGLKADVGFAQDPDADRLAIVDEEGAYIGEEYTLVLAAVALLEARKAGRLETGPTGGRAPVIVTNLSTSRMIDDVAARYAARVERTPVGEANVVERMMALRAAGEDVVLGGEGNGGVIWPEVVYVRDSLSAMALTLALMARTGKSVSELVAWIDSMAGEGGGGYAIVKHKVEIPSRDAARPAVTKVIAAYSGREGVRVDTQDGVRVDWPARLAWVHVRASNTEPIMRLIAEAPTRAEAEAILGEVGGVIGRGG